MKVKIVKGNGTKTVEEIRAEKMEMLKRNVIESCIRSIAEADAIAYAVSCDDNFVLELIARTLLNYAKKGAGRMNKTELYQRLEELRKVINGANTLVFSGDMFQAATWTTTSLQLITEILRDLSKE